MLLDCHVYLPNPAWIFNSTEYRMSRKKWIYLIANEASGKKNLIKYVDIQKSTCDIVRQLLVMMVLLRFIHTSGTFFFWCCCCCVCVTLFWLSHCTFAIRAFCAEHTHAHSTARTSTASRMKCHQESCIAERANTTTSAVTNNIWWCMVYGIPWFGSPISFFSVFSFHVFFFCSLCELQTNT